MDGEHSEYDWLVQNRSGWIRALQTLIVSGNRQYDVLRIAKSAEQADVYFDITEYFGKF